MKMKVLFLVDTLEVGGAEKSLLEILQRFQHTDPVVCSIYAGEALKNAFEASGIRVLSLGLRGKYRYFRAIAKVVAILRSEKPDLIHTTLARSHFVGRAAGRLSGIPVISSLVSDSYSRQRFGQLSFSRKLKLRATQLIDRTTSRWALHFFANSKSVKTSASVHLGIAPDKISVVYRGRDASRFANTNPDRVQQLRRSLSLPDHASVILNVGRLVPSKAQKELILSIPSVRQEFPVHLLIAGEGPFRSELLQSIEQSNLSGMVTLLGHRDDVPELLQLADVFVFPSYYEGHPGALVEAMFAGCPIVASDIPVHREMIVHNQTGLLVSISAADIADAIRLLLRNPEMARSMSERIRIEAVGTYDITRIANRHEELYEHLLPGSPKLK